MMTDVSGFNYSFGGAEQTVTEISLMPAGVNGSWFVPVHMFAKIFNIPDDKVTYGVSLHPNNDANHAFIHAVDVPGINKNLGFLSGSQSVSVFDGINGYSVMLRDIYGRGISPVISGGNLYIPLTASAWILGFDVEYAFENNVLTANILNPDKPYISVSSPQGRAGQEVTVDVTLHNNQGVTQYFLTMKYDAAKLTYVKAERSAALSESFNVDERSAGVLGISAGTQTGTDNFDEPLALFSVTFKINEGVADGDIGLTLDYSGLWDGIESNQKIIKPHVEQGNVKVANVLYGDVNNDGNVNILDLSRLQRFFNGVDNSNNNFNAANADTNGDGVLNILDLSRLRRYFNGIDPRPLGPQNAAPPVIAMAEAVGLSRSGRNNFMFAEIKAEPFVEIAEVEGFGETGENEVTFAVTLRNNPGVCQYFLTLNYDPAKAAYVGAARSFSLSEGFFAADRGGRVNVSASTPKGYDAYGDSLLLFTVTFRLNEGVGVDEIGFSVDYSGVYDGFESNFEIIKPYIENVEGVIY
jgi:hypothetical protein